MKFVLLAIGYIWALMFIISLPFTLGKYLQNRPKAKKKGKR